MTPNSITQIRELRDTIREKLKTLNKSRFANQTFGGEQEYDINSLIKSLEQTLSDISGITRAPKKFLENSSFGERRNVINQLTRINQSITAPANFYPHLENLKISIRNFQFHRYKETFSELENDMENLQDLKRKMQNEAEEVREKIIEIGRIKMDIEKIHEKSSNNLSRQEEDIKSINHQKDQLHDIFVQAGIDVNEIKEFRARVNAEKAEIERSVTEIKSNEKLVANFAQTINDRNQEIDEVKERSHNMTEDLKNFESVRQQILKQGKDLIEKAKNAMNYTTAYGLSSSFKDQFDNANNYWIFGGWITGAIMFFICTLWLGQEVLTNVDDGLEMLIGRIALLPLPVIGTIFCANQYTKQKQLKEDYAYKTTISKAIVGFSDQLKKNGSDENEEYIHYIKTSLEEIHKDPLRNRGAKQSTVDLLQLDKLADLTSKIVNLGKTQP